MRRERLYVGMNRGRHENHTYRTTERTDAVEHPTRPMTTGADAALDVLREALANSRAARAAHALLPAADQPDVAQGTQPHERTRLPDPTPEPELVRYLAPQNDPPGRGIAW